MSIFLCRLIKVRFSSGREFLDIGIGFLPDETKPQGISDLVKIADPDPRGYIGLGVRVNDDFLDNFLIEKENSGALRGGDIVIFETVSDPSGWEAEDSLVWMARVDEIDEVGWPSRVTSIFENPTYGDEGRVPSVEQIKALQIQDFR